MKIVHVGAISTGTVILLGLVMVVPVFFPPVQKSPVLLTFNINDDGNLPTWCDQLSSVLKKYDAKAVVFVSGKIAQEYPQCVNDFSDKVDIGSSTFDYLQLTLTSDYAKQLDEIQKGKSAVDAAGKLESKIFKAPYGNVDDNIYSLLTRSGILADFSYHDQYNKYYNGQFIKFDLVSYDGNKIASNFINGLGSKETISINFDNTTPVEKIDEFISKLDLGKVKFFNASDVTGVNLTVRGGGWFQ